MSQQQASGAGITLGVNSGYAQGSNNPTVRSGFECLTGTWAARIKLSDIDSSVDGDRITQAFWLSTSFHVINPGTTKRNFWSEVDHEWQNWFGEAHNWNSGIPPYAGFDATGYWEETPDQNLGPFEYYGAGGTPLMRSANPASGMDLSCSITYGSNPPVLIEDATTCMHYFVYNTTCPPGLNDPDCEDERWVVLTIHYFENGDIVFRMAAVTGGHSSMSMSRLVDYADFPPTQPFVTMFSLGIRDNELEALYEMKADWFYYASDPDLTAWQLMNHVVDIKEEGIERLHIVPPMEAADEFRVSKDQISASAGPDPVRPEVELLDPTETVGNAPYLWVVRPTPRATLGYIIRWREKYIYENGILDYGFKRGGLTRQTPPYGHSVPPDYGALQEVQVSVQAQDDELVSNQKSVITTRTYTFPTCAPFCASATSATPGPTPIEFALTSVHPNPTRDNSVVTYTIPFYSEAKLTIVDVLGREIAVLTDDYLAPGLYTTILDSKHLPSGVYFVRMQAGSFQASRSITVIN